VKPRRNSPRRLLGNPLLQEQVHDPYHSHVKPREATSCPQCGVRYRNGRWTMPASKVSAFKSQLCPACRRINDDYPAGELILAGSFPSKLQNEIIARIRHVEEAERQEHPLNRIIEIAEREDDVTITTTDIHLPHRIAHALHDAFGGKITTHYDRDGYFTRVLWERNE
jgi:hypothetical protein